MHSKFTSHIIIHERFRYTFSSIYKRLNINIHKSHVDSQLNGKTLKLILMISKYILLESETNALVLYNRVIP